MIDISFFVPIIPKPSNKRHAMIVGGHARVVQDKGVVVHQAMIAAIAARHRPPSLIDVPVRIDLCILLPRPFGMCKLSARTGQPLQDPARRRHASRPDIDNLQKSVLDGLKSWWRDDSQVCEMHAVKWIAALNELTGYHVRIRTLEDARESQSVAVEEKTTPVRMVRQVGLGLKTEG